MLFVYLPIFVADRYIISGYDFVGPFKKKSNRPTFVKMNFVP